MAYASWLILLGGASSPQADVYRDRDQRALASQVAEPSSEEEPDDESGPLPWWRYLKFYGHARLDVLWTDARVQNPQAVTWVLAQDGPNASPRHNPSLLIHPRETRLGLTLAPIVPIEGLLLDGRIELDFDNGGTESRQLPRLRQAYVGLDWGWFRFLAGQSWDIMSPLLPTPHTLWYLGNLGDRRPQVQLLFTPTLGRGKLRMGVSASMPSAVDNQDLDGNGDLDGADAAVPMMQGLIEIHGAYWTKAEAFRLGVSGHYAREILRARKTPEGGGLTIDEDREVDSWSLGAHLVLPFSDAFWIRGEAFYGRNLNDLRGSIGQDFNPETAETIRSGNAWAEVGVKPASFLRLSAGASVSKPDDSDLATGQRSLNAVAYAVAAFTFYEHFEFGFAYKRLLTRYVDRNSAEANRIRSYAAFRF